MSDKWMMMMIMKMNDDAGVIVRKEIYRVMLMCRPCGTLTRSCIITIGASSVDDMVGAAGPNVGSTVTMKKTNVYGCVVQGDDVVRWNYVAWCKANVCCLAIPRKNRGK